MNPVWTIQAHDSAFEGDEHEAARASTRTSAAIYNHFFLSAPRADR